MSYEAILTPYYDAAPRPRVEVLFESFAPGTARITLYRTAQGRAYEVRGAVNVPVAGAFSRIDLEVPFGVEFGYYAFMVDAAGMSLGATTVSQITMSVAQTWVHNPLDPQGATTVEFRGQAARSLVRPSEGEVVYPMGRTVGVLVSGQRRGLSNVDLTVVTDSVDQVDRLQAMLGGYGSTLPPILCISVGAYDQIRLPRPFFAAVLSASEQDDNYVLGGGMITTEMQGSEVSPPSPGIFISLLKRDDIDAFYPTRADIDAGNATRLDIDRRYELIGLSY
jgi:hypothetical protein